MRAAAAAVLAFCLAAAVCAAEATPPAGSPSGSPPPASGPEGQPGTDAPASPPAPAPVYLSMDFTDVELPVLVKFISEQTKKNFVFDERVQGKITIISPRRITLEEAYNVFLSVLHVKGFATVEQDNTIRIIPMRDAKQESLPTERGPTDLPPAKLITRLIPLEYVDSADIVPLLTPLISKDGLITSFPPTNTLILIDSKANTDRILSILADLDQEKTGATLRIFPLKNASATEVAKTLESLYQDTAVPAAPGVRGRAGRPGKARGAAPRFLPDLRTNTLLVLAPADLMGDIADLLAKLDIPAPENTGKINVYYLENANAEELAKVLSGLTERRGAPAPGAPAQPATIRGVISAELEGGVRITADKATNSLIIIASMNDYLTLVDVVKKLDIRRRQVYVEALIMEVDLDNAKDLGIEWRGAAEIGNEGAILTGTNFDFQGNVNDLITSLALGNPLVFPGTGLIAGGIGGTVTLPDGTEIPAITAILRAAQSMQNINILSSPHILTLDNQEAEIVVGENVPFITSQSRDSSNLANVINTVERKDVGITLRITPHIHESEFVNLEIYQESSAVKEESLLAEVTVGPTTTKRSAKTNILVKDANTVVLGGMMQEVLTTLERKVPLLGDIPILGYLFKYKSTSRRKTNLLIFLTPHVIRSPEDMLKLTTDQQNKMDRFLEKHRGEVERLFPQDWEDREK